MKIFIQIASYRDPQLVPTIKSALENAKKPKNLVFGIARQYHPEDGFDNLDEYKDDKRFRILNIPHEESKGVCWARHQVQQLYSGETYTMQIDSHMRFEKNWDDEFIKMIKQLQKDGQVMFHHLTLITTLWEELGNLGGWYLIDLFLRVRYSSYPKLYQVGKK